MYRSFWSAPGGGKRECDVGADNEPGPNSTREQVWVDAWLGRSYSRVTIGNAMLAAITTDFHD
jgi:hypothetical protein